MDIIRVLKTRYSTKEFDSSKKLTDQQISQIEDLLQLSPSSTNIQPWHFIIANTENSKNKIAKATQGFYEFNQDKVLNASAVVIFASQVDLKDDYLEKLLEQEDKDGRFPQTEFKEQNKGGRSAFAKMHKYNYKDYQQWTDKQVYLNLGNFLLGTACLGLDTLAMEGVDFNIIDEEFGLREKGYTSTIAVAVGFHKESDFNKDLPKSRLPKNEIIELM